MSKKPNKKKKQFTQQPNNQMRVNNAQERQKAVTRQRERKEKLKKVGIITVIIVLVLGLGIPTAALMSIAS